MQGEPTDSARPEPAQTAVSARLWGLCALALALVLTLPFWLVEVPPVLDYPNHLAGFYVLAHPGDPILSRFYAPHWALSPNLGLDAIGAGLAAALPIHVAGRLSLALALLAPVAGTAIYARAAFGRWTLWSLASGLVAFNGLFLLGFMNFLMGVGLALAGGGAWILARRRGPLAAILVGAAASALVFVCHLSAVAFLAVLLAAREADGVWRSRPLSLRRAIEACAVVGASLAPAALLYLAAPLAATHQAVRYRAWDQKLLLILTPVLGYGLVLSLVCAAALVLILRHRGVRTAQGGGLALGVLALLYLVAPGWAKGGAFVDTRITVMAGFLIFAALTPRLSGRAGRVAGTVVVALIGARTAQVGAGWLAHRRELAEFRQVIAAVPPGSRVLAAYAQGGPPGGDPPATGLVVTGLSRVNMHLPALLVIERRAFWPLLFADPSLQPLAVRPPYDQIAFPLGELFDAARLAEPGPSPQTLAKAPYLAAWRSRFDYVLLLNVADPPLNPAPPAPGLGLVRINQAAALYRIGPRPPIG